MGFAPIHIKQATMGVGAVIATVNTTESLEDQFTAAPDISSIVNNVTISGGENDVSIYNTMSGQLVSQSRASMIEMSFEAAFDDTALINLAFGTSESTASGDTFTRVTGKDMCGETRTKAVLIKFTKAGKDFVILINNAYFTTPPMPTMPDDGAATVSSTLKCIITDYAIEEED